MDLFHTITQSLDNVLTCDWYESFKNYGTDQSNPDDKTMDTETGGETSQYGLTGLCSERELICNCTDMSRSRP